MKTSNPVMVGWAMQDITPNLPVSLYGLFHMRVSNGVKDPVTATALSLSSGDDLFIWVSCDILQIPLKLLTRCHAKLQLLLPDFPPEKLVINATHTHTAPYPADPWDALTPQAVMRSDAYCEFLADRVAKAAAGSWKARKPGAVAWGSGYAVLSHNRRSVYSCDLSQRPEAVKLPGTNTEKYARMYGDTSDAKFMNIEGSEDHRVNVLYTFDEQNSLTGAVINLPCPSQASENLDVISADFWHEARLELKRRHGEHLFLLPQCSPAGDLSPHLQYNREAENRMLALKGRTLREDLACRLADAFDEIYPWVKNDIRREVVLKHSTRMLSLARRMISEDEYLSALADLAILNAPPLPAGEGIIAYYNREDCRLARKERVRRVLTRYEEQKTEPTLPMELHVIRLGDVVFATNAFELFLDFGVRITAQSPAVQTFLVQLAGEGSYLATQKATEGEGYSACLYCCEVGAEGGAQLVEESVKAINALWENNS
jgi:hypothetical protein